MKEYGGYLPLELNNTGEYYNFQRKNIIKTNSGLTAIYCALKNARPDRVFLPFYICPTVDELVESMGLKVVRYNINSEFMPDEMICNENDCVVLVNYFGLNTKMINKYYSRYNKVIIDNTEAFFADPIMEDNVYNVYSCRKFIGVSDGGYLVGKNVVDIGLERDFSSPRSNFLMMQYEYGIDGAYSKSKESYQQIRNMRKGMSVLTERILCSVDYLQIKEKRIANFTALNNFLKFKNNITLDLYLGDIPYSYPYMIKKDIRKNLIDNKIYIPWIWKEKSGSEGLNETERMFVNYIYHLPIDQRYDEMDMKYIAEVVLNLTKKQE